MCDHLCSADSSMRRDFLMLYGAVVFSITSRNTRWGYYLRSVRVHTNGDAPEQAGGIV